MTAQDRARCAATAALLRAWSAVAAFGLSSTGAAIAALVLAGLLPGHRALSPIVGVVLAITVLGGLIERFLWLRLRLDHGLFAALSTGTIESLPALDDALGALGLRAASVPARPLAERIAGTRRLLRQHGLAVGAQAVLLLGALVAARW